MDEQVYVSRGGLKLHEALGRFGIDVAGAWCVDLGCSTGGFVDCLLQHGAARVYAVDTAYGELAWKLRQDERVVVMERTNALHADVPPEVMQRGGVDWVTLDLGWTKLDKAIQSASGWLKQDGAVIALVKPHYEAGVHRLEDAEAERVAREAVAKVEATGVWRCRGMCASPVRGGKGKNLEWLAWLERGGGGQGA